MFKYSSYEVSKKDTYINIVFSINFYHRNVDNMKRCVSDDWKPEKGLSVIKN